MKIIKQNSENIRGVTLILGFFDGIHKGHRDVINLGLSFGCKTVMLTFTESPSAYFNKPTNYIYPREYSYRLIEKLGVDYIAECDFSKLVNINAIDYINKIVEQYSPKHIVAGFNHSFGYKKEGNNSLLMKYEPTYGYKFHSCSPCTDEEKIVSSSYIKTLLSNGDIYKANELLVEPFTIQGTVIKGLQLGRKLGYPTANIKYPEQIIKLPYGVYKAEVCGKPAVLNWGIKPTIAGQKEGVEVHIIDFDDDLYGKNLSIKIINKIRNERKFNSLDELKVQIKKDTEECLK